MTKPNNERKRGLAHLAHIIIHPFEFQAFQYFITLEDLEVEIEDKRMMDESHMEVLVSVPQHLDPKTLTERWRRWEKKELLFDYAVQN